MPQIDGLRDTVVERGQVGLNAISRQGETERERGQSTCAIKEKSKGRKRSGWGREASNLQHSNVKFICGGEATKLGNFYGTGRNEVATKYRQ